MKTFIQLLIFVSLLINSTDLFAQNGSQKNYFDERSAGLELRYGFMFASGNLHIQFNEITSTSGSNEVNGEFPAEGTDGTFSYPALALGFRLRRFHFGFEATPLRYHATALTEDTLVLDSLILLPGAKVNFENNLKVYSFMITGDILEGKRGEFGVGLGLTLVDYNVKAKIQDVSDQLNKSVWLPAPSIALKYEYNLTQWEFNIGVMGVWINYDGVRLSYLDADLTARYKIIKKDTWTGMITGGLRYLPLHTTAEAYSEEYGKGRIESSSTYIGPYLGLRFELVGNN